MRTKTNLKTSIKCSEARVLNNASTQFVVGNSSANSCNWRSPEIEECLEASLFGTVYIFVDGLSESIVDENYLNIALKAIQEHFDKLNSISSLSLNINQEIKIAFLEAHHAIVEVRKVNLSEKEACVNIFIAWIINDQLYAGWNSECNFYAFQNGILDLLDYESMEISSNLDFENTAQLSHHKYIGSENNPANIKILRNVSVNLNEIDRLLFCSYEFHNRVCSATIENVLRNVEDHEETASALIEAYNSADDLINSSLWLMDLEKIDEKTEEKRVFKKKYTFPFLGLIIALGIGFVGGTQFSNLELQEQVRIRTASIPGSYSQESADDSKVVIPEKIQKIIEKEVVKPKKIIEKEHVIVKAQQKTTKVKKKKLTGRMKVLEDKVIDWNNNKFSLLKKMNALESFLPSSSPEALKELNILKERRTKLNAGLVEIIQLDKNGQPVYDEKNQIFLSSTITQKNVEQKFWRLHHQLEALEKDLKELCKRYYCKDLIK